MMLYLKTLFLFSALLTAETAPVEPVKGIEPKPALSKSVAFGAISDGKKVIVCWTAPNEINYDYFTIEKSKDGINFVAAVMIKGAGRMSTLLDYTDIDYEPFSGISYYRLKQTDYFGDTSYSEIIAVNFQPTKNGAVIPGLATIPDAAELAEVEDKPILVVLSDNKGNEYITKVQVTVDNNQLYANNLTDKLNPGTYLVRASSFNRLYGQKITFR
jgi:hypothetical protein